MLCLFFTLITGARILHTGQHQDDNMTPISIDIAPESGQTTTFLELINTFTDMTEDAGANFLQTVFSHVLQQGFQTCLPFRLVRSIFLRRQRLER